MWYDSAGGEDRVPRRPRVHVPGGLYHVVVRGNAGQAIFRSDEDRREFLERLSGYAQAYGFSVYAYALLDNNFHLLVE